MGINIEKPDFDEPRRRCVRSTASARSNRESSSSSSPGEQGAHQLINRADETARFLAISTMGALDVVVYPDSNKIACHERGGLRELHFRANAVDYWDGESPPG